MITRFFSARFISVLLKMAAIFFPSIINYRLAAGKSWSRRKISELFCRRPLFLLKVIK
ncbi:MAG: hypothetical protein OP8BY_1483 [Candidatus Saccharicenans subterraneus]|uniref:Uncharacterized protein n=1 Tax=Candidatus Saccharicenans subterraneus TaxID=2508984 RepID=A0A3E2BJH3_9BACT|nr:MAG: hypothetical protein OP8BY_1483 [Candidatus Saccharicenans subterraneum]